MAGKFGTFQIGLDLPGEQLNLLTRKPNPIPDILGYLLMGAQALGLPKPGERDRQVKRSEELEDYEKKRQIDEKYRKKSASDERYTWDDVNGVRLVGLGGESAAATEDDSDPASPYMAEALDRIGAAGPVPPPPDIPGAGQTSPALAHYSGPQGPVGPVGSNQPIDVRGGGARTNGVAPSKSTVNASPYMGGAPTSDAAAVPPVQSRVGAIREQMARFAASARGRPLSGSQARMLQSRWRQMEADLRAAEREEAVLQVKAFKEMQEQMLMANRASVMSQFADVPGMEPYAAAGPTLTEGGFTAGLGVASKGSLDEAERARTAKDNRARLLSPFYDIEGKDTTGHDEEGMAWLFDKDPKVVDDYIEQWRGRKERERGSAKISEWYARGPGVVGADMKGDEWEQVAKPLEGESDFSAYQRRVSGAVGTRNATKRANQQDKQHRDFIHEAALKSATSDWRDRLKSMRGSVDGLVKDILDLEEKIAANPDESEMKTIKGSRPNGKGGWEDFEEQKRATKKGGTPLTDLLASRKAMLASRVAILNEKIAGLRDRKEALMRKPDLSDEDSAELSILLGLSLDPVVDPMAQAGGLAEDFSDR